MRISIGIDIGSDGGFCIMHDNRIYKYGKIPYNETEADMKALSDIILESIQWKSEDDCDGMHVCIEDLHSVFGSSAKSNFSFGVNNGLVIGMLQVLELPFTKVIPKRWQKQIWEGIRPIEITVKGKTNKDGSQKYKIDTKATSLIAAKRLFPKETFLATERSKVPSDGIVDAVLICEYCRRNFQ